MLDSKLILEQSEFVQKNNEARNRNIDVSLAKSLLEKRLSQTDVVQQLRTKANEIAQKISSVSNEERVGLIEQGKQIKEQTKEAEVLLQEIEKELDQELKKYPNIIREDVPIGKDESFNVVLRTFLEPTQFSFEPKDHLTICEAKNLIDVDRATKVSGTRFAYVKGDLVLLEFALIQYALSVLQKHHFIPVIPPHIISKEAMSKMGYLEHGGEEEIYHLKNDESVLIGTSEQAIGPMHMNEILDESLFPLRYVGFSPCYRREAGSYGRDTRGILRMHQFDKIEMFSFCSPETSDQEHQLLVSLEEELMKGLQLPHRVMLLCSGDIGTPSARTYDIETWMPSQKIYRETHSTSNTTDFQTRRLQIRMKREGKNVLAHALNGTAFALGRTMIAIIENNQTEDGGIRIPDVLVSLMGGKTKI